jgi:glutamyl-tRNA synthetase
VGGARTALYNYLLARSLGGEFVLRIEDTDRERSEARYTDAILDSMTWLGIECDEGPYYQSERLELYRAAAERLLESGVAYWDDDPEKGRAMRVRMPDHVIKVGDLLHDEVEFDGSLADDFVILKSDGYPAYNFACVVDDADMGITHVVRGDEHLSNMPRQLVLYEALGYEPPKFAHIPMILGPDGSKLSKRHGATAVGEYRKNGFLPEALANFVALLGWSPGGDRELMTVDEMCGLFTLDRVRTVSSQFDNDKLLWMNGQYIQNLPPEKLASELGDFLSARGVDVSAKSDEWMKTLASAYRQRLKTFEDIIDASRFLFADKIEFDEKAVRKVLAKDGALERLTEARDILAAEAEWTHDGLEARFAEYCEQKAVGFGKVAQPIRVAVTGGTVSPPIFETLILIGRDVALRRINAVIEGGVDSLTAS